MTGKIKIGSGNNLPSHKKEGLETPLLRFLRELGPQQYGITWY